MVRVAAAIGMARGRGARSFRIRPADAVALRPRRGGSPPRALAHLPIGWLGLRLDRGALSPRAAVAAPLGGGSRRPGHLIACWAKRRRIAPSERTRLGLVADLIGLGLGRESAGAGTIVRERRRIARELHDELGQTMALVKLNLERLHALSRAAGPEVERALREATASVDRTIAETRRIVKDLQPQPLDDLGLGPALRARAAEFSRRTGIDVRLRGGFGARGLGLPAEIALYRFFQEGLTNVARHARARRVTLSLARRAGIVRAIVRDDGIGLARIESASRGHGLPGMRQRIGHLGGAFRVDSRPGRGTALIAEFPVPREARALPRRAHRRPARTPAARPRRGGEGDRSWH